MRKLSLLILPFLLAACSMVGLGEPSQLEITEFGIFKDGLLVSKTNGVPQELGQSFGLRFKIKDPKAKAMKARIVTSTPGLIDPAKEKVQKDFVSEVTLQPGESYDVIFTFSQPWELVTGHWEFKVETEAGETLSQTFDVYNPNK